MSHNRAAEEAARLFAVGLTALRECADILRGPEIHPSPDAMRTELAVSRAIDALGAGFRVPEDE